MKQPPDIFRHVCKASAFADLYKWLNGFIIKSVYS